MTKTTKQLVILFCTFILFNSILEAQTDWSKTMVYFNKRNAYPQRTEKNSKGYYNWSKCWDEKFDSHPVGPHDVPGIPEECRPDTLYSWGGPHKLQSFLKSAGKNQKWDKLFDKVIFSHINPLATFGYGPIAFRIKLKPSVKFKIFNGYYDPQSNYICTQYSLEEQMSTVIVRIWNNENLTGVDYIFCSPQVIHSWSYNTKAHYDEIVASLSWNNDVEGRNNWIPYTYLNHQSQLFNSNIDGHDWSPEILKYRMDKMQSKAAKGEGLIFYAPTTVDKSEKFHFKTKRPIYWNTSEAETQWLEQLPRSS